MQAQAQRQQRAINRDQHERTGADPDQLDRLAPFGRAEREPGHASQDRNAKAAQLGNRRERTVELRHRQRRGEAGAKPEQQHHRQQHRPIGRHRKQRLLRRVDDAELDVLGLGVGVIGDLCRLTTRHQFLIISLQHAIVTVKILRLSQHARHRLRNPSDAALVGFGRGEATLRGSDIALGVD